LLQPGKIFLIFFFFVFFHKRLHLMIMNCSNFSSTTVALCCILYFIFAIFDMLLL
jgi:hypothetical protein